MGDTDKSKETQIYSWYFSLCDLFACLPEKWLIHKLQLCALSECETHTTLKYQHAVICGNMHTYSASGSGFLYDLFKILWKMHIFKNKLNQS